MRYKCFTQEEEEVFSESGTRDLTRISIPRCIFGLHMQAMSLSIVPLVVFSRPDREGLSDL